MNKLLSAFFALFAITSAQVNEESTADTCMYEAQDITTERSICLAMTPQNCNCFNESSNFYRERPECIIDPYVEGSPFNAYARMCNAYNCEGCVTLIDCGAGLTKIYDDAMECLALYTSKDKDSYAKRCECLEPLKEAFDTNPDCKSASAGVYENFTSIYEYNFCGKPSEYQKETCLYEAENLASERSICLAQATDNCSCLKATTAFYNEHPECIIDYIYQSSAYQIFDSQCDTYGCECSGFDNETEIYKAFEEAKACLNRYNLDNQSSDYGRCMCIEELNNLFMYHHRGVKDRMKSSEMIHIISYVCYRNVCDRCPDITVSEGCEYVAWRSQYDAKECIANLGLNGTTEPDPRRCPCLDEIRECFEYSTECKDRTRDEYIDYLRQCGHNRCGNCSNFFTCGDSLSSKTNRVDVCLDLLEPEEGETKVPDPLRCICLDDIDYYLWELPMCKYDNDETIKLMKRYAEECEFNGCSSCTSVDFNCTVDAKSFENESDACLEMFGTDDTAPNTEKCQCIEGYAKFFNSGVCKYESGEAKRVFDKYVSQCNYNKCKNCPGGNGSNGSSHVSPMLTLVGAFVAAVVMLFI